MSYPSFISEDGLKIDFSQVSQLIEYNASDLPEYVGYPDPSRGGNADTGEAIWCIQKIEYTAGGLPDTVGWTRSNTAAGTADIPHRLTFVSAWDDRASLTYT